MFNYSRAIYIIILLLLLPISIQSAEPRIALVLSGGGSRGAAEIGLLKCLEDNNIKIDYIVGTSIGAVIGGLYSVGYSATDIDSIFSQINWDELISIRSKNNRKSVYFDEKNIEDRSILTLQFNNFKFISPEAFSDGAQFKDIFHQYIINSDYYFSNDFNNLKYPFRAIATDLVSGKSVALASGSLSRAIQASTTIPINYAPVRINDMVLIDGGVMANIPTRFAKEFEPDLIIAMDATTPIRDPNDLNTALKIADQVISVSMAVFAQNDAALADILITPIDTNNNVFKQNGYLDFANLNEQIKLGYKATQAKIDLIKEKLDSIQIAKKLSNDTSLCKNYNSINASNSNNIIISDIEIIRNGKHLESWEASDIKQNDYPFHIGDTISKQKIQDCYNFLEASNKYDNVDIQILPHIAGNKMRIELEEKRNQSLRFMGRVDDERAVLLGINFVTKNIFSTNLQHYLTLQASGNSRYAGFTFFNPQIFNEPISVNATAYYDWNNINVYNSIVTTTTMRSEIIDTNFIKRRGLKFAFGSSIGYAGLLSTTYRIENQSYGKEDASTNNWVTLLGLSLRYDSQDAPYFATEGGKIDISLETNLFSKSDYAQFSKIYAFLKTNITSHRHTFIPSLFFGTGDMTLPYPEQFSLGGQDNFFGMRENERLGRQIFRSSVEYRYKFPNFLSVLAMQSFLSFRYDIGSAWEMPEQIKLSTLRHGLGGSFSIDSPIGPAVFSIGRAFSFGKENNKLKYVRFGEYHLYFSLGMAI